MDFDNDAGDYDSADGDETWAQASPVKRGLLIGFLVVAMSVLAAGAAYAFTTLGGSPATEPVAGDVAASPPRPPTGGGARETPSTAPPTATPSTASRSPSAKPTHSLAPPRETRLPPPPPPQQEPACPPTTRGTNAPKTQVKAQLLAASQRAFSRSVPSLRIPVKLLNAVAWQESGWKSAIVACDGGIGTMQVMPDTAVWMNNTYETTWDVNSVNGNVMLGGQMLAWLTKYFGDQLGTYDLNATDTTLLDAVISGYNFGPGNVDLNRGHEGIRNWQYVNNVKALMNNCPCSSF